jgi:glutathione S-transferase
MILVYIFNHPRIRRIEKNYRAPIFLLFQLNPQHAVPTLVDGDFVLTESRAIAAYIANVYGKDTTLLPNDPKIRAR